jgi:hypothetical protein
MSAINGRRAALARAGDCRDSLSGCRFLDDDNQACGEPRCVGSSYCPHHHRICYLPAGSSSERIRPRTFKRIADAVGGKASAAALTNQFIARLERLQ